MSTTPIPVPGPEASDAILANNLNYWHWFCNHQNSNAIAGFNVACANWSSNDPFFVSKGLPHPKPVKPVLIQLLDAEFVNEWDLALTGQGEFPGSDPAFVDGKCFSKKTYVPPAPPVHPPVPVAPVQLGEPIPNSPGKFMIHPGDISPVGTVTTVNGHKYRKIGNPTPFGMEDYWQQIS